MTDSRNSYIQNIDASSYYTTSSINQPQVVHSLMNSWYNWLVNHVPKTIRKHVSVAYGMMKNKVMPLFSEDMEIFPDIIPENNETNLQNIEIIPKKKIVQ